MAKTIHKRVSAVARRAAARNPDLARGLLHVESLRIRAGKTLRDSILRGHRRDDPVRARAGRAYCDALARLEAAAARVVRLAIANNKEGA